MKLKEDLMIMSHKLNTILTNKNLPRVLILRPIIFIRTSSMQQARALLVTLRPEQNEHHFTDEIFQKHFFQWNALTFVSKFIELCFRESQLTMSHN